MKRLMAGMVLLIGTAALSGCYYDPGYSYVRSSGYQGDAYYGQGPTTVYEDGYYDAPGYYGYGPGYYGGYAPGVSLGISSVWYGGSHRHRDHDRYRDRDDHRWREAGHDRGWQHDRGGGRPPDRHYGSDEHRGRDRGHDNHDRGHDSWHGHDRH